MWTFSTCFASCKLQTSAAYMKIGVIWASKSFQNKHGSIDLNLLIDFGLSNAPFFPFSTHIRQSSIHTQFCDNNHYQILTCICHFNDCITIQLFSLSSEVTIQPYRNISLIRASNILKNIVVDKSPSGALHGVLNMSVTPFLALQAISFREYEKVILVVRKKPTYL